MNMATHTCHGRGRAHRAVLLSAAALLAAFAVALLCVTCLQERAYAEAGYLETQSGSEVFADTIQSDLKDTVQTVSISDADGYTLAGDFTGGWGSVLIEWSEGDSNAASALLASGAAAADSVTWKGLSSTVINGELPNLNHAVKAGGKSQQFVITDMNPGTYVYRLMCSDSVGYSHSIYWVVAVQGDQEVSGISSDSASTSVNAAGKTSATASSKAKTKSGDGANTSDANSSVTVNNVVNESGGNAYPTSGASPVSVDGKVGGSVWPQTGDELELTVGIASALAVLAAAVASFAIARSRAAKRKGAQGGK